ncbi:MAG: DUF5317 domain-containing protein [Desulfitobacteriaceae bacterium]
MLIEMLIFAIVISLISGGKISQLGQLAFRGFWLVPLAFMIQICVYWAAVKGIGLGPSWVSWLFNTASYLLLLIFTLLNWSVPGIRVLAFGILLNSLVITLNGGMMPVDPGFLPEASRKALLEGQGTHGLLTSATLFSVLADRFYLDIPLFSKQVFSIGDIFIDIGSFILVFQTMTGIRGLKDFRNSRNFS